ncbi:hypothetical protein STEG23_033551 [Scotinomys teguina]
MNNENRKVNRKYNRDVYRKEEKKSGKEGKKLEWKFIHNYPLMGYRAKQRIYGRRILNGRKTFKEMLNILTHQRNANQNNSKIPSYTCQNG